MDGSNSFINPCYRLLAQYRTLQQRDTGTAEPPPDSAPTTPGSPDPAFAEFARLEIDRISEYVEQQVHELSENLKSLRSKLRRQAHLIDDIAMALESAISTPGPVTGPGGAESDDFITTCFVDLRLNVESLTRDETAFAGTLQFQDRVNQELAQLHKILAHCAAPDPRAELDSVVSRIELSEVRERLMAYFGRSIERSTPAADDGDDIVIF